MHYQVERLQGKLVIVVTGCVLGAVVDVRKTSATFGQDFSIELNSQNNLQLWVLVGMAHGFMVLSETADFMYKSTDYYKPQFERTILWNNDDLAIDWQLNNIKPELSVKDADGVIFKNAEYYD